VTDGSGIDRFACAIILKCKDRLLSPAVYDGSSRARSGTMNAASPVPASTGVRRGRSHLHSSGIAFLMATDASTRHAVSAMMTGYPWTSL